MVAAVLATLAIAPLGGQGVAYEPPKDNCKRACERRVHMKRVVRPYRAWIANTARCESGGRWWINTGNGFYGGMQFTLSSWRAVGGWGYPHQASKLEQSYRSVLLLRIQGRGAWPVCG